MNVPVSAKALCLLLLSSGHSFAYCTGIDYTKGDHYDDLNRVIVAAGVAESDSYDRYQESFVYNVCMDDLEAAMAEVASGVVSLEHGVKLSNQLGRPDVATALSSKFGTIDPSVSANVADSASAQLSGVGLELVRDAFDSRSIQQREFLQHVLQVLGYYESSLDGSWGPGTARAFAVYFTEQQSFHQVGSIEGSTSANELLDKLASHYDMLEGMADMQESE